MPTPEERFWTRVERAGDDACWLWKGAPNNSGYGAIGVGRRVVPVHRFAYTLLVGEIPCGLQIDHLCRTRLCVNPAHLEAVTAQVNVLRSSGFAADESRRTHCPQGHPYDEQNTYRYRGLRYCKTCNRARTREAYAARVPSASPPNYARGERVAGAKLTDALVAEIRSRAATERQSDLARVFGVSDATISLVVRQKIWRGAA